MCLLLMASFFFVTVTCDILVLSFELSIIFHGTAEDEWKGTSANFWGLQLVLMYIVVHFDFTQVTGDM